MAPLQKHLETDMENMHSLPNLEEARTQNIIAGGGNKYSGKKKRTIALIVVLVAVIATAVGFSVGVSQNNRAEKANALSSSENGGDGDDDTNGDNTDGDDENAVGDDGADPSDDQENDDIERFDQVKSFLEDSGIATLTNLQTTTSPQYKAAVWMANDDERELDIPESLDEDESYKFVQRYAMAVFYYALGGAEWTRSLSFLSGEDVCDWSFDLALRIAIDGTDQTDYDYGVSCWDEDADDYGDSVTWIFMRTSLFCFDLQFIPASRNSSIGHAIPPYQYS